MSRCGTLILVLAVVAVILTPSNSWRRRRRRKFNCPPTNCKVGEWSVWAACSHSCNGGTTNRTRKIIHRQSCGGYCPPQTLKESKNCNTQCCPVDCVYSWGAWSTCIGCGISTQSRTPKIEKQSGCNGKVCPRKETKSCKTGKMSSMA